MKIYIIQSVYYDYESSGSYNIRAFLSKEMENNSFEIEELELDEGE